MGPASCQATYKDRLEAELQKTKRPYAYPQFYIQLVFKAPLCITLTISDQKIVSGILFFQLLSTFSKKKNI